MKNFENVYKELENLFINKLPDYIDKVNIENNDGIILKPFENTKLEENCIKLPAFNFAFEEADYEEKDRIIENTVYEISIEIKLPEYEKDKTIHLWRYIGVINKMLLEEKMKILNIFKLPKYKAQNFLLS